MPELPDSYLLKSYELGYAMFRVAGTLPDRSSKAHLEDKALDIILAALEGKVQASRRTLFAVEYLIRFLSDVGMVHPNTSKTLLKEVAELNAATGESGNPAIAAIPAEELFPNRQPKSVESKKEIVREVHVKPAIKEDSSEVYSQIRQSKILDKIRQSGNCRLRDIQEVLPDTSERTLRYDMQRLVINGLIERIGNGGPSTFYKIRPSLKDEVLP